jgi:regulatory protein
LHGDLRKARNMALRYLGFRQRSEYEMVSYLTKKGFDQATIGQVIDELKDYRYLDDRSFAGELAESYCRRGFGPKRASWEMKRKRLDSHLIDESVSAVFTPGKELEKAREILNKKFKAGKGSRKNRDNINYLAAFLERRGFSACTIVQLINELSDHS